MTGSNSHKNAAPTTSKSQFTFTPNKSERKSEKDQITSKRDQRKN